MRIAKPLMSVDQLKGEEGQITKYEFLLSSDVAIGAYLLRSMAAFSAGFKLAESDDWL